VIVQHQHLSALVPPICSRSKDPSLRHDQADQAAGSLINLIAVEQVVARPFT